VFGFQSAESAYQAEAQWEELLHDATDQQPFVCPYPDCGHAFKYNYNLNVHQRKKHGGIYGSDQLVTFFCRIPNCGRSFYSRNALAKHRRCIHNIYEENWPLVIVRTWRDYLWHSSHVNSVGHLSHICILFVLLVERCNLCCLTTSVKRCVSFAVVVKCVHLNVSYWSLLIFCTILLSSEINF